MVTPPPHDDIERLLEEKGHDLAGGKVRVAAGRTGIAVGLPDKRQVHVSWGAVASALVVRRLLKRRRKKSSD